MSGGARCESYKVAALAVEEPSEDEATARVVAAGHGLYVAGLASGDEELIRQALDLALDGDLDPPEGRVDLGGEG